MIPSRMAAFRSARRGRPGVSRSLFRCFMFSAQVGRGGHDTQTQGAGGRGLPAPHARCRGSVPQMWGRLPGPSGPRRALTPTISHRVYTGLAFLGGQSRCGRAANSRKGRTCGPRKSLSLVGFRQCVSWAVSQVGVRESVPFTALAPRRSSRNGVGRSRLAPSSCGADNQEGEKEGDDGGATDRLSA